MNYDNIKVEDMNNGPGLRVTIWVSGCEFACPGCFNEKLWDFCAGKEYTEETESFILAALNKDYISGLTLLGGEPLHEKNRDTLLSLVKKVKSLYPNKTIWSYTGNVYEQVKELELVQNLDVLIDGRFMVKLFDPSYKYAGSRNQRVIDIKKTIEQKEIIIFEDKL